MRARKDHRKGFKSAFRGGGGHSEGGAICGPYLLGLPLRKPALVQITDHMGVCLDSLLFQVPHKGMAQLGGQDICHKVCIEEDALQPEAEKADLPDLKGRIVGRHDRQGR